MKFKWLSYVWCGPAVSS
ncbi:hypothetical protein M8C21_005817 [Ambrosia artemisiifolia]|uniref:Uncharacterized protein n=1 Tax=Ambrosia artemisiifolia TaxID=4212 RepID=A0AAD5GRW2_AMBAR|nr:hypothetical protein M8C21_005817 [Ambrosia artemisiifolia]